MTKIRRLLTALFVAGLTTPSALAADLVTFWDTPRHGANCFNEKPPDFAYFKALRAYGATWVRLSCDKWKGAKRDCLIGDADKYSGIPAADLAQLKKTLDAAQLAGLKVVLVPLSLPGARWAQNNGDKFDDRLWKDRAYWAQAAIFWHDLALSVKNHPAIAALNLYNEPTPERNGGLPEHSDESTMKAWYVKQQGGTRDLLAFYKELIGAVRTVDKKTPIMVDAGWYGAADAFSYWPSGLGDSRVLYSFHMYEPYAVTSTPNVKRAKPILFPGMAPFQGGKPDEMWDRARVTAYLELPVTWAKAHGIAMNRLVAGEFGCIRTLPFCAEYLENVLSALDKHSLHWAFYSFRESWDGFDYELGGDKLPWKYWQAVESGKSYPLKRSRTKEFEPIAKRLAKH